MRAKSLALLVLALGCGLVASIGITQVMAKRDTKPDTLTGDSQTVFVAMEDLSMGEILTAEILKLEQWPKDKIPAGALTKIEDVEGRRTKTMLYAGEPVLERKLYDKGDTRGGVAVRIPKGYRAVPVKVDDVSGGADMILEKDLDGMSLASRIRAYMENRDQLARMSSRALKAGRPRAREVIAQELLELVSQN